MFLKSTRFSVLFAVFLMLGVSSSLYAEVDRPVSIFSQQAVLARPDAPPHPVLIPTAPKLNAKGYLLQDVYSGKILAAENADKRMEPASLTKLMTLYIAFDALRQGRIHLEDPVHISEKAWKMGGSKMFVKVNTKVPVEQLIKGVIIASGNDGAVALAEHIAGSEEAFVNLMNQQAQILGMDHTHFTDSTGMPAAEHYTTPRDMATLAGAIIKYFPEYYAWFSEKWFTYNGIKQPNRNRLLWREASCDGLKTGHTDGAGYCLVAAGLQNNMRLVAIVMGTQSDEARTQETHKLLTYGFSFFETHKLYANDEAITKPRIWSARVPYLPVGLGEDLFITIPRGQFSLLKAHADMGTLIKAPIEKSQVLGKLTVSLDGKEIATRPLVALQANPKGGLWTRFRDMIALTYHRIFN